MFSLGKRSNYRVIEEEEDTQNCQSHVVGSTEKQNPCPALDDYDEENEEEEFEGNRSMFESAPPNHHEITVSFKTRDNDPELLTKQSDDLAQWDHIKDVDQFFFYIYEYYQQKGFTCIALRYLFSLLRFAFVVLFSSFLLQCVDYDILFYNRNTTLDGTLLPSKRKIQDAFVPQCYSRLNPLILLALILATVIWIVHFIRICRRLIEFYEIKQFFSYQLQIVDSEMQNLTWPQLVQKLCHVQQRLHLIVNKQVITSLDIYQRILRHKNYFVALVYYDILPPKITFPIVGPIRYLSTGLRFNIEWLLFWGPWSAWKGPYALKDEYKDPAMLLTISRKMQKTVIIMAFTNLILFPFVFVYQVLFSFFTYSEHFQRDRNIFGMRKYSSFGREKLRHFNEMDHELDARLNRSYEFATRYTDQFISPLSKIVARNICFVAAAFFVVLCGLTAYDEDTLKIEHVTTMISITGGIVLICRVFIPNEHMVYCQHSLMRQIVANIHYAPKNIWLINAHSLDVYREFTQIFRLKMELLVEELLSPLFTPFILYFCIWKRIPEIVTFLHEHTIHIDGLGDVCSLAQMDIVKDGDVRLASLNRSIIPQQNKSIDGKAEISHAKRNAFGKVELSLLNYATQNPDWIPPKIAAEFIQNVKELVSLEVLNATAPIEANINQQQQKCASFIDPKTLALLQASSYMSLRQMEQSQRGETALPIDDAIFRQRKNNNEMNVTKNDSTTIVDSRQAVHPPQHFPVATSSLTTKRNIPFSTSQINYESVNGQHQQSTHPNYLVSDSRLLASSFITPSPLAAIIQPQAVQESNLRATEMSLNALAVNHMLFLNNTLEQPRQNQRIGSYGSIFLGNLRRNGATGNVGSRYGMDSVAESNIWGVPAESSSMAPQLEYQEGDDAPLPMKEKHGLLLH